MSKIYLTYWKYMNYAGIEYTGPPHQNDSYNDNQNLSIIAFCLLDIRSSSVVCQFKCSSPFKSGGFWLAANVFIIPHVPPSHHHYSCGVDFPILIKLEQLLKRFECSFISLNLLYMWCDLAVKNQYSTMRLSQWFLDNMTLVFIVSQSS